MLAHAFAKGQATGKPGETIAVGRMGKITIGPNSEAAMAPPFTYDKSNVDQFAKIF
jgi:rhamnose transport system substrate-binding protein